MMTIKKSKDIRKTLIIAIICVLYYNVTVCQTDTIYLSMSDAINIANDSSLQAFLAKNALESAYWRYNNYKAQRLPSINFKTTPLRYNRSIQRQYSWTDSGYVYLPEQNLYSSLGLTAQQNLTLTGGTFYVNSDLTRLQNMGVSPNLQYNSTWISVGYSQPLFGYNSFKWEKKIEPLAFQTAQKEFIESRENITLHLIPLFFGLADSEMALQIAKQNYNNADTLYAISEERFRLAAINKADLLTLKLDLINSKNELKQAKNKYERAKDKLLVFLRLRQTEAKIILPELLPDLVVEPEKALQLTQKNNHLYLKLQNEILLAKQHVNKTKIESRLNASLDASFGLNKNAGNVQNVYIDPLDQQMAAISLNIPIVDWGVRKSKYNIAKNSLVATEISIEQQKQDFEQSIFQLIGEFNLQKEVVISSKEAAGIAMESFSINKDRFLLGRINVNMLSLQKVKKDEALRAYIMELQKYWTYYYQIRQLTLYDFENQQFLVEIFESNLLNQHVIDGK